MKATREKACLLAVLLVFLLPGFLFGAEYNVTQSMDFTGPYAAIMKSADSSARVFYAWWNDTVGSKIGVKLNYKPYETRYDPSVVASLWPGILSSDKPIAHAGLGGPDLAALMKRLPKDKVPMMMSTGCAGFMWSPNQWIFLFHPVYSAEGHAFLKWVHKEKIRDRPIRIGMICSQGSPMYVDYFNGYKKMIDETDWLEFVGVEWVDLKPVSILSEMRRLAREKPDFIGAGSSTLHALSAIKAQKELGIHIPLILHGHSGLDQCASAIGGFDVLEGHYDVFACASSIEMTPAAKVYEEYRDKMGIDAKWSSQAVGTAAQTLLICRAVERAANKVGPDNITGEAVYNAMYEGPFREEHMLGLTGDLHFTKEAPFPLKGLKAKSTTVKSGKHVMTTNEWLPIDQVPKW